MAIIRGQEVGIHFVPLSLKSVHWFGRDVTRTKTRNCFIIIDLILQVQYQIQSKVSKESLIFHPTTVNKGWQVCYITY